MRQEKQDFLLGVVAIQSIPLYEGHPYLRCKSSTANILTTRKMIVVTLKCTLLQLTIRPY
jgi:hypothetical protein